jgi:hypothetical protein
MRPMWHILGRPKLPICVSHRFGVPTDFMRRKTGAIRPAPQDGPPACPAFWQVRAENWGVAARSACSHGPPRGAFWANPGIIPGIMRHGLGTVFRCAPAPGALPGPGAAAGEPPDSPSSRGHMPKFAEKTISSRRFWPPATVENWVPAAQKGLPAPATLRRGRDGAGAVV